MTQRESSDKVVIQYVGIIAFCLLFVAVGFICLFVFPADSKKVVNAAVLEEADLAAIPLIEAPLDEVSSNTSMVDVSFNENSVSDATFSTNNDLYEGSYKISVASHTQKVDAGLGLYRSVHSRAAVEWFYTNITDSRDVACAILEAADKNDIPVSLAFALAYTESRYKVTAVNRNTNASIDRGLFQLNNKSFPALAESDFFDPYISAKYGMSHLRHCLDTAGNEVSALAMYNAGTNRVRNNATPQVTLNYVSNIISYRQGLDELFESEVAQFYRDGTSLYLAAVDNPARAMFR